MTWHGPVNPPSPVGGRPSPTQQGTVVTINGDGTVDLRPDNGRATKIGVPVISHYVPSLGDVVYFSNLDGDANRPVIVEVKDSQHRPVVTGSRATGVPLAQLLAALDGLGLITDQTTA